MPPRSGAGFSLELKKLSIFVKRLKITSEHRRCAMSVAHGRCKAVAVGLMSRHDSRERRRCGISVPLQDNHFILTQLHEFVILLDPSGPRNFVADFTTPRCC